MPLLHLTFLGGFDVRLGTGPMVVIGRRKAQALLAFLVVEPGEAHLRDKLAALLWGDSSDQRARQSLRQTLLALKQALPQTDPELLRIDAETVAVNRRAVEVDTAVLEQRVAQGTPEALAQAAALYGGDFLEGLGVQEPRFEEWLVRERERMRELALEALAKLLAHQTRIAADQQAIRTAGRFLALDPLQEPVHRALMRLYARQGRRGAALRQYQLCVDVLRRELGVEPEPVTTQLYQEILRTPAVASAPPERVGNLQAEVPLTAAQPSQDAFVGRHRELEALRRALETACGGSGSLWLLVGEAGIGKTRVADELAMEARRAGATVLWARCWEGEGAPAFWPWVELIRAYVRECDGATLAVDMGAGAASIAQVVPDVSRQLPGLQEPADLSPADARFRFFDAVASFLRNAARRQPLVLVLDDLHWADTPSLLLLRFVARETRAARLLIVGTARDADLPADHPAARALGQVAREGRQLELRGLSGADLARFIELLQGAKPAAQLVEAVHRRTDGNPFFAGEVVRLLTAAGESGTAAGGAAIPLSVRQAIHHRVTRLSPDCVRVLQIAAVVGAEFDLAVVEGVAAVLAEPIAERARLLARLDECVRARLVAPRPRVPGGYRFTHALVRETLYDELGSAARAQHHRCIGDVLERLHADDPEPYLAELAHHFFAAAPVDETGRALAYAIRAAERSTRRLAYEDAAEHYRAALQVLALSPPAARVPSPAGGPPDTARQRCELLIALGEARARAGETAAARDAFVGAAELARGLGAVELLASAALGLAGGADVTSRVDALTIDLLEEALAGCGAADSPSRARLLSRLATALYFSDAAERRAGLSRLAVEIAERLGDPVTLALVLHNAHFAVLGPDSLDERMAMASRIIALGEATGRRDLAFAGHYWRLVDALERGDIAVVDASQRRHAELAEELGQPFHRWRARVLAAMRAVLAGRLADAERLIDEALQLGRRATPNALLVHGVQLYGLRREQGRLDEIEPAIRAFAEEHAAMPAFRSGLALLCCHLGRLAEAGAIFDELAAQRFDQFPRDANWLNAMDELAQVCAALGDGARAALLYERLAPYERHNVVIAFAEGCEGSVARYLGLLAATMARWDDAVRHFDAALAMNAALGAWPQLAHTQREYAAVLRERDGPADEGRAAALQAAACAAYGRMGMSSFAARL